MKSWTWGPRRFVISRNLSVTFFLSSRSRHTRFDCDWSSDVCSSDLVVLQGGWWDLFQRGEPLLWESLKHSTDRVLFMSPHYHIGSGPEREDPKLKEKWFAHWLLGVENGVQKTPKINLYPINGAHWEHFTRFPLPKTNYQRLHLSGEPSGSGAISLHDGSLTSSASSSEGGEEAPLLPASSPCSRETAQWTAGAASTSA